MMIAFDIASVVSARFWVAHKNPLLLAMAVVFFAATGFFFAYSMQFKGLAIANTVWAALSTVLITLIGYFLFKEEIAAVQFAGIAVIVVGLILVNLK